MKMAFLREWSVHFKTYNHNIKLAFWANIFAQIGLGIFSVVYNFYIRELGFSQDVNGQIISLTSLGTALMLVPAGIMSDRIGRKKVMMYGVLFAGVVLFLRSILEPHSLLIVTGLTTGVFTAFLQVSSIPWLSENSSPEERVHLFSLHSALMTAASVIGNLLGGMLTDAFSLFTSDLSSIRYTLIIGSVFYFLAFIPISKMMERRKSRVINSESTSKPNIREFFAENKTGIKIIALFAIAQILIGFGSGLVIPYLNLYFADRFAASNSIIGLIISLGQAATAVAMFIGPLVVQKVGQVKAVVYLQLASLPFLLLTAYTNNLLFASVGFLFRQALMNAGNPIQSALIMSKVDNSVRGLANSVNQMVFQLGWAFMGPVSTAIVIQHGAYWGYAQVFSITAFLYLIGSLYFFFVFRKIETKPQNASKDKKASNS